MKLLLTGANGFVGSALLKSLEPFDVRIMGRSKPESFFHDFFPAEINSVSDYSGALEGVDVVIHMAARVHVMNESESSAHKYCREVNTYGTLNLARQAAEKCVKRFIFISSVKVNGEHTNDRRPFCYDDKPNPQDPYGFSKAQAEAGLLGLAEQSKMEVVIIRPPLVYGPGVKANFLALMNLAKKNLPLPLGSINNKRSLVSLENLVDLILICLDHPAAANQVFLVSDDRDLSTPELLKKLTIAAVNKPRIIPFPPVLLKLTASLLGKKSIADRLLGSLQIDITHTKNTLDWAPSRSVDESLKKCFD